MHPKVATEAWQHGDAKKRLRPICRVPQECKHAAAVGVVIVNIARANEVHNFFMPALIARHLSVFIKSNS